MNIQKFLWDQQNINEEIKGFYKQMTNWSFRLENILQLLILGCLVLNLTCQNTHQKISTGLPKLITMQIKQGDQVRISIFNTNAQFQILYQIDEYQIELIEQNICFFGEQCSLEFQSQWETSGRVMIQVLGYQYSYEVVVNDKVLKREDNVVTNFIAGRFIYNKKLPPTQYTIRVSYNSSSIPQIMMSFLELNYTIIANQVNEVIVSLQQSVPFYEIHFSLPPSQKGDIEKNLFSIDIQLPNQMLQGCDGSNVYDPKVRVCPVDTFKRQDSFTITKMGSYPTFYVEENQKTIIKLTIIEYQRWEQFFEGKPLVVYISNRTEPKHFYNMTKSEMSKKHKIRQQCYMTTMSCAFTFMLEKGNYTAFPVFPDSEDNAFVYLFQRSDGTQILDSYYSILPIFLQFDQKYYQVGPLIQFMNEKEKLTEINIQCKTGFILLEHTILKKMKTPNEDGQYDVEIVQMDIDSVFNQDLNAATIYAELQPQQSYLLLLMIVSYEKFQNANRITNQQNEDLFDFDFKYQDQQYTDEEQIQQFFYLQADQVKLSIKNGKFPHRKLQVQQSKQKTEQTNKNPSEQQQVQKQSEMSRMAGESSSSFKIALTIVVFVSTILYLVCKFYKTPTEQQSKGQSIVTQQSTGNTTITGSSLQLSHVSSTIKTQRQSESERQTQE